MGDRHRGDPGTAGSVTTINEIRAALARRHGATIGCPITCGIFAWIAANAASEAAAAGKKRITPYWRTLKTGGILNEKYPGGASSQKRLLESEGHKVLKKGRHGAWIAFMGVLPGTRRKRIGNEIITRLI